MSEGTKNILKRRKDKECYSSLIGRHTLDNEIKFREFFRVWRDIVCFFLNEVKADTTKIKKNKIKTQK